MFMTVFIPYFIFKTYVMSWLWQYHVSLMHTPSSKVLPRCFTIIFCFSTSVYLTKPCTVTQLWSWPCKPYCIPGTAKLKKKNSRTPTSSVFSQATASQTQCIMFLWKKSRENYF